MFDKVMRMGTVASIALVVIASAAQAKRAQFIEAAIGCPSKEGLIAVYKAAGEPSSDFNTVQAIVEHYGCEWIEKGVELILISRDPVFAVVVRPHVISKDVWYYVPSRSVAPIR
jgi:hypothetical protein